MIASKGRTVVLTSRFLEVLVVVGGFGGPGLPCWRLIWVLVEMLGRFLVPVSLVDVVVLLDPTSICFLLSRLFFNVIILIDAASVSFSQLIALSITSAFLLFQLISFKYY